MRLVFSLTFLNIMNYDWGELISNDEYPASTILTKTEKEKKIEKRNKTSKGY